MKGMKGKYYGLTDGTRTYEIYFLEEWQAAEKMKDCRIHTDGNFYIFPLSIYG